MRAAKAALAGIALVFLVAGCGSQSVEAKLAALSKAEFAAATASCTKVGLMLFVGQRETVYDCRLTGVDLAHRAGLPLDQLNRRAIDTCWVYTAGSGYNVSKDLGLIATAGGARFACA